MVASCQHCDLLFEKVLISENIVMRGLEIKQSEGVFKGHWKLFESVERYFILLQKQLATKKFIICSLLQHFTFYVRIQIDTKNITS